MKTLTISVESTKDAEAGLLAALQDPMAHRGASLSFVSDELLWRVLTPNRWAIMKAMTGQNAMSIRHAARLVGRDIKGVHADVQAMLEAGVLDREGERIVFPYEAVRLELCIEGGGVAVEPVRMGRPCKRGVGLVEKLTGTG